MKIVMDSEHAQIADGLGMWTLRSVVMTMNNDRARWMRRPSANEGDGSPSYGGRFSGQHPNDYTIFIARVDCGSSQQRTRSLIQRSRLQRVRVQHHGIFGAE